MAAKRLSLPILALTLALVPVVPATSRPAGSTTVQSCGKGSWIAGTVDICNGKLIYRDYVYND